MIYDIDQQKTRLDKAVAIFEEITKSADEIIKLCTPQPSKAQRTRQRLLQVLKDRLATPGPIRTGDAWEIYRRHRFGYATGAIIFKSIMEDMITAGTARKTGKGQYWIGPGEPEAPPEKQEDPPAFVHKPYYRSSDEPAPKAPSHGSRVKPFFSKVYGTMISPD